MREAGYDAQVEVGDFFDFAAVGQYDVVVGNPPYVRYQDFSGISRAKSRALALRSDVELTGLASSWAAFTIHAAAPFRGQRPLPLEGRQSSLSQ